ncbi:MAG: hypothetical protein U0X93_14855 [Anaerolineales bacterium]
MNVRPMDVGIAALIALNILEGFDLASLESLSVEKMHLMIERCASPLPMRVGTCLIRFSNIPVNELLSKDMQANAEN